MISQPSDITENPKAKRKKHHNLGMPNQSANLLSIKRPSPLLQKTLFFQDAKTLDVYKSLKIYQLKTVREVHVSTHAPENHKKKASVIPKLCKAIKRLKGLSNLSLDLHEGDCIGIRSLAIYLRTLSNLSSLEIRFNNERDEDFLEGINIILRGLKYLSSLARLDLNMEDMSYFKDKGIEDLGMTLLSSALKSLPSLSSLELNLQNCRKITDEYYGKLFRGIRRLSLLSSLLLNVSGCKKITNKGIKKMCVYLQRMSSLKVLDFNFNNCFRISEKSLSYICICLIKLRGLTSFTLDVSRCKNMTNQEIEKLSAALKNLSSLSNVDLNFSNYNAEINDKGIEALCLNFKELSLLSSVKLNFEHCHQITDKSIENLSLYLRNLSSLSNVTLTGQKIR